MGGYYFLTASRGLFLYVSPESGQEALPPFLRLCSAWRPAVNAEIADRKLLCYSTVLYTDIGMYNVRSDIGTTYTIIYDRNIVYTNIRTVLKSTKYSTILSTFTVGCTYS